MRWLLPILAVPLLYLLSVPWMSMIDSKLFHNGLYKSRTYFVPWSWLAAKDPAHVVLRNYYYCHDIAEADLLAEAEPLTMEFYSCIW